MHRLFGIALAIGQYVCNAFAVLVTIYLLAYWGHERNSDPTFDDFNPWVPGLIFLILGSVFKLARRGLKLEEDKASKSTSYIVSIIFIVLIILFFLITFKPPKGHTSSVKPECIVEKVEIEPFMFVTKDEPNAGFIVNSHVKNLGSRTSITTNVRLSTSEGDFQRSSSRIIDSNETKIVRIDFPEPTVNASDIQAQATCETNPQ